ncbi:O-antigen ligase family protein [Halomonas eurihalina]|uniref:O-antigen ligase family protein n=1 Tax=Halomonas eurihalina TaxID=42566 RepID=UPI001FE2B777|nr:O-antigen ligase family protein [Halomonas eurihalina]MDR5857994.1 O-antigen ligase family protein [Halomonas eurihalina]
MKPQHIWESPVGWSCSRGIWALGVIALLIYAGGRILWPDVGSPAETTMALLGLVMVLVQGKGIRSSAALWLLLAAVVVQVLSWTLGYFHHPQWVADNPQVDRLAKLFIFIAVAWWLGGSTRNTLLVWGLAVIALLLTSVVQGNGLQEWIRGLEGHRVGFGVRNYQHGAMLFGVALLGLAVFAPRIMAPGRWRAARIMGWCLIFLVTVIAVMIGQTRAVWLALALCLPCVLVVWRLATRLLGGGRRLNRRLLLMGGGMALLVVLGAGSLLKGPLVERVGKESQVIGMLLEGDVEEMPYTSIGTRIHSWQAALEWIQERPLVGWGGTGRSLVIEHTPWLPETVKQSFGHLHNYFLEIWVAYGLIGVALIAALASWIGMATWRAWRGGALPGDMALFGVGFFLYWMVVNQFESYNSFWTGVYVHNLVVGGLITHYWRWQRDVKARDHFAERSGS